MFIFLIYGLNDYGYKKPKLTMAQRPFLGVMQKKFMRYKKGSK